MTRDDGDEPRLPESIWDTLRRDEPDPRAIEGAYLRFLARRPATVSPFMLVRWLAAGFAAGWGVAFAATGDPLFGAGLPRREPEAVVPDASAPVPSHESRPASPAKASAAPPNEPEIPLPDPSSSVTDVPKPNLHGVLPEASGADPKWQRAATALKARDYTAAEAALRELETAGAAGDRDAASLALAQVLLTRGRLVEARARFERLSRSASSPLVREKATLLLAETTSGRERSSPAAAVPQ